MNILQLSNGSPYDSTIKSNIQSNKKTKLPVTIANCEGRKKKMKSINQTNKFANKSVYRPFKLQLIPLLCHHWQKRNTRGRKEPGYIQNLRKISAGCWSPWSIRLCNGPYCIFMISTALFYVKNSNKYHLFSAVQKLRDKNWFKVTWHLFCPLGIPR